MIAVTTGGGDITKARATLVGAGLVLLLVLAGVFAAQASPRVVTSTLLGPRAGSPELARVALGSSRLQAVERENSNAQTFADATGDSGSAPDVTTVAVSNDDAGTITFQVAVPNRSTLGSLDFIGVAIDSDQNPATGSPKGVEYVMFVFQGGAQILVWNGSTAVAASAPSFAGSFAAGQATFTVNRSDLGGTSAFNFSLQASADNGNTFPESAPDYGAWSYPVTVTGGQPPPTPPPPSPEPPGCRWSVVSNAASVAGDAYGLSALSTRDVWAVGSNDHTGGPLIERWDGQSWRVVAPAAGKGELNGVSAVSASSAWAVGDSGGKTLVEHWDGNVWRVVPTPSLGRGGAGLTSVAALSDRDVWAVGGVAKKPLIEHWDGRSWHVVFRGSSAGSLEGVSARRSSDVWAVGFQGVRALIEHWDGKAWRPIGGAGRHNGDGFFDVAAFAPNDVWAFGSNSYPAGAVIRRSIRPLVQHWNARAWRRVPSPVVGHTSELYSIAALSPTDIWAEGITKDLGQGVISAAFVEHWDGARWQVVPIPEPGDGPADIAAVAPNDIWVAVNKTDFAIGGDRPVYEHYSCTA